MLVRFFNCKPALPPWNCCSTSDVSIGDGTNGGHTGGVLERDEGESAVILASQFTCEDTGRVLFGFYCEIVEISEDAQALVDQATALAGAEIMVTRLTPCLQPPSKEEAAAEIDEQLYNIFTDFAWRHASGTTAAPARRVSDRQLLACRVLQPWKKQMLHAMWETVQLGYSPNPLGRELANPYQEGEPGPDAYPALRLTNGESISLLLWASTRGGGGKVNTDLLHNLQFEEVVVEPLERGHYNTGAIIGGSFAMIAALVAALMMLFLMLYASFHMLIVIALFPLTMAFFPIPKLRNLAIRSTLSMVRSAILVGGMLAFVYSMGILQEIIFDISKEVPAVLASLFLVGGQLMLLFFPFKLFSWSKKTNTKLKARLQNESTWKQLRGGGVAGLKQFGKDVGQDMRTAGRETFGSGKSLTADQGGQLPAKSAAGGGATSVSAKAGSAVTATADRAGKLAGIAGMPATKPGKATKPDSPATADRAKKQSGGAKMPSTDAGKELAALRIGKKDAAGIETFGGMAALGEQSSEVGASTDQQPTRPGGDVDVGGEDVVTAPSATPSTLDDTEGRTADEGVSPPQDGGVIGEQIETAEGTAVPTGQHPVDGREGDAELSEGTAVPTGQHPEDGQEGDAELSEGAAVPVDQHPEDDQEKGAELSKGNEGYIKGDDPFAPKKRGIRKATGDFVKGSIRAGGSAVLRKAGETELGQSLKGAKESVQSAYNVPKAFATAYREGGWEALRPAQELETDHDKKAMDSILSDGSPDYRSLLGVLQNQHRNEHAEQIRNQKIEEAVELGDETFKGDKKILQDQEKEISPTSSRRPGKR